MVAEPSGWRDDAVRALVGLGVLVVLSTETLSLFHALGRTPLIVLWCAAALLGVALRPRGGFAVTRPDWFRLAIGAAILWIGGVTAVTALASPPNSVDAFGYHLARVVYWAQAGAVAFFPAHYLPQISMPPMAEYAFLHTWLLSGADRFVNLVQWTGFVGSIAAVSLIARESGAAARGQWLAALFAATLPNAILQASGAKNDCVLALWLAAMVYFALRWSRRPDRREALFTGAALGLALLTKSTAVLFSPPLLVAAAVPGSWRCRSQLPPAVALVCIAAVAINAPHWLRNLDLSGSVLGPATAQDDPRFEWTNQRLGLRTTISNLSRHVSQQLAGRGEQWNRGVYDAVLRLHRAIGADPNDPVTTWPGTRFATPVNSNHEADAPNRIHLLVLVACAIVLIGRRDGPRLIYLAGPIAAFLLVCIALKYQPFFGRIFVPLFIVAAPVFGIAAERIRPAVVQAGLCLLLFDQARLPLLENWTRPLSGPASILETSRYANYFRDMQQFDIGESEYRRAADLAAVGGCRRIGIDNERFHLEYPLLVLLLERDPRTHFVHTGVRNASAKYADAGVRPCAIVCLGCAGDPVKTSLYASWGEPVVVNRWLVYPALRGGLSTAAATAPAIATSASFR